MNTPTTKASERKKIMAALNVK
jgi:hypothetical protein